MNAYEVSYYGLVGQSDDEPVPGYQPIGLSAPATAIRADWSVTSAQASIAAIGHRCIGCALHRGTTPSAQVGAIPHAYGLIVLDNSIRFGWHTRSSLQCS